MKKEIWKSIKGYEKRYHISNQGRVRSLYWGKPYRISALKKNNSGYLLANLHQKGTQKMFLAHRLVAAHFISYRIKGKHVNHKDGDKENNTLPNLEIVSCSENIAHAYDTGLRKRAQILCVEANKVFDGHKAASESVGLSPSAIASSINRKCKAGGFTWLIL